MKKLNFLLVAVLLLGAASFAGPSGSVAAQADAPVILLHQGDLWRWTPAEGLAQLTEWGHNGVPVVSPDGASVAYNSTASEGVTAAEGAQPGTYGDLPSNIWLLDLATGEGRPLAGQPDGAGIEYDDPAIYRGDPVWSPDGTQLAWSQLIMPAYTWQVVTYDLASGATEVVATPPAPFADAGYFGDVPVRWSAGGIAISSPHISADGMGFVEDYIIYPAPGAGSGDMPVTFTYSLDSYDFPLDFTWAQFGERYVVALLFDSGAWRLLDPVTGLAQRAVEPPSLLSPTVLEAGLRLSFDATGTPYHWTVAQGGQVNAVDLPVEAYYLYEVRNRIALAPDGSAFAVAGDALYLYQEGALAAQPGTELPDGLTYDAVAWGATQWMLPIGLIDYTCDPALPPRLEPDGAGRVLPGSPNNVRDGIGTGANVVGQIPGGESFLVIDGPVCDEGIAWWQVAYEAAAGDVLGWTAEGVAPDYFLEPLLP